MVSPVLTAEARRQGLTMKLRRIPHAVRLRLASLLSIGLAQPPRVDAGAAPATPQRAVKKSAAIRPAGRKPKVKRAPTINPDFSHLRGGDLTGFRDVVRRSEGYQKAIARSWARAMAPFAAKAESDR